MPSGSKEDAEHEEGQSLRNRLRSYRGLVQEVISDHSFSLAAVAIVAAAAGTWLALFLPNAGADSARWSLSALVQGTAAILGTTFVGLTFIWNEADRSVERLRALRRDYTDRLTAPRSPWTEAREGVQHTFEIDDVERMRRLLVDKIKSGEFHDDDDLLQETEYKSHADYLLDVSALYGALLALTFRDVDLKLRRQIGDELEAIGLPKQVIDVELFELETKILSDPVYFFDVLTDIFGQTNLVPANIDEKCGQLQDEIWDRGERDDIWGLLIRVTRMRELRGQLFRYAMLFLIAAITWGLVALSGYDESTSKAALIGPLALGLVGTALVAVMIGRILTIE